jgi:hypothetical protein
MAALQDPESPTSPSPGVPAPEVELPDQATRHQDTYRKVMLGQVADPIFPPAAQPPTLSEEEFMAQAIGDPGPRLRNRHHVPPLWRWLFLVFLVSIALSIVLVR